MDTEQISAEEISKNAEELSVAASSTRRLAGIYASPHQYILTTVSRAARKAALAASERDDAIRAAHEQGATLRAIAKVAGVSHQRVWQIVNHRR